MCFESGMAWGPLATKVSGDASALEFAKRTSSESSAWADDWMMWNESNDCDVLLSSSLFNSLLGTLFLLLLLLSFY